MKLLVDKKNYELYGRIKSEPPKTNLKKLV